MKCRNCNSGIIPDKSGYCESCKNPICERIGCGNPATKSIYGLGYLASVCQEHYDLSTQKDKEDAIRFRYAER